jgi:hypothetical protein
MEEMKYKYKWILFLFGCFGAELFRIGGIGIKSGDVITVPHKIETLTKDKNDK